MIQVDDFDGDLKFNCRLDEHMGSQIYWCGGYSRGELRVLDQLLEDGMTFVDIGANQGEFSVFAAKRLPNGQVISLEPMSHVYEMLKANIRANGFENVSPFKIALTSGSGPMPIYTAEERFEDGTVNEGLGTLHSSRQRSARVETVECKTLDEFVADIRLQRLDVLKIDIEGGEYDALVGAQRVLKRFSPAMIVEVNATQTRAAGHELGELVSLLTQTHELWLIDRNGGLKPFSERGERGSGNVLCRPRRIQS